MEYSWLDNTVVAGLSVSCSPFDEEQNKRNKQAVDRQ